MANTPTRHNGYAIRDIRVARGLTIDEVAARTLISAPHLRNIENELRDASPVHLAKIAEVLGCRAAALVRDPAALAPKGSAEPVAS